MKKKVLIKHSDIKKFIFFICKNLNIPKKEIDNLCKSLIGSSLEVWIVTELGFFLIMLSA